MAKPVLKRGADCCGCTACASVCGRHAITMTPDLLGFKYPVVDYDKCVECGLCEKVCQFKPDYATSENFETPIPYGVRQKDIAEVMKSRSGGAFKSFSDWVLARGGVVYGAGFKGHFEVAHCRATTPEERDALRGSKYVQSNLDGVFAQVRDDLKSGKWVLFSGTPCQTSGLKSFLPVPLQEKLLVVDIVCHGVPSPSVWHDHLKYIGDKYGSQPVKVDFRDKKHFGWHDHKETYTLADGREVSEDTYTYLFYKDLLSRDSCNNCHFTNVRRPSDLTLADFWGWEKTDAKFNADDRGASLVLVNTPKGREVFEAVCDRFDIINPRLEECMQGHLREPSTASPRQPEFIKDYEKHGYPYVLHKYGNVSMKYKLSDFIFRVKRKLKKLVGIK